MKRKVTTIEEYYGAPRQAGDPNRSTLQKLVDYLTTPTRHDFYPLEQKRHYYPDGSVLKSMSLSNGTLYAGCCKLGCPRRCVPISEFRPDNAEDALAFDLALRAHDSAVAAHDLDVATEQRAILEEKRSQTSLDCRRAEASSTPP